MKYSNIVIEFKRLNNKNYQQEPNTFISNFCFITRELCVKYQKFVRMQFFIVSRQKLWVHPLKLYIVLKLWKIFENMGFSLKCVSKAEQSSLFWRKQPKNKMVMFLSFLKLNLSSYGPIIGFRLLGYQRQGYSFELSSWHFHYQGC